MIIMTLNTVPVGQMRARSCVRGRHAGTYKAKEQVQREQSLAALLAPHVPPMPLDGPLVLCMDCYLPIPKSKSKRWKEEARQGIVRPTTKPDADNLAKHLKDVMGQLRFWNDDKQVVDLVVRKRYSDAPRWVVTLDKFEPVMFGAVPVSAEEKAYLSNGNAMNCGLMMPDKEAA